VERPVAQASQSWSYADVVKRWLSIAAGLVLQTLVGVPLSFVSLIGTQGMHSDQYLGMTVFPAVALCIVHAIASAVGLFPVALSEGGGAYRAGILGAVAGALLAAILFSAEMLGVRLYILPPLLFLLPTAGAAFAIAKRLYEAVPGE